MINLQDEVNRQVREQMGSLMIDLIMARTEIVAQGAKIAELTKQAGSSTDSKRGLNKRP